MLMSGMKRRGLFGAPMTTDTPTFRDPNQDTQPEMPQFREPDTKHLIAGVIGDTLSQLGGGQGTFLQGLQQQRLSAQQAQATMQRAQAERANKFTDWKQQYDYQLEHPQQGQDDVFTRTLTAAGIDPMSPRGRQMYEQRAQTLANPVPQWIPDGMGGGRFVAPPSPGGSQPPSAPVGKLTPMGGATSGSRSFPIR